MSLVGAAAFVALPAMETLDLCTEFVGTRDRPPGLVRGFEPLDVLLDLGALLDDPIELLALRGGVLGQGANGKHRTEVTAEAFEQREDGRRVRRGDVVRRLCEESDGR